MDYQKYKYKGIMPILDGDLIGYALFKSGHVLKDFTEIPPVCIKCSLNKEPLKDIAKLKFKVGEFFISAIYYSKKGNYLGDEQDFFKI